MAGKAVRESEDSDNNLLAVKSSCCGSYLRRNIADGPQNTTGKGIYDMDRFQVLHGDTILDDVAQSALKRQALPRWMSV